MTTELVGEFIGTMLLILLGNGVVANVSLNQSKGKDAGWLAINVGWGLAVLVAAYASGSMSPAHLNPAVSIGVAMAGGLAWGAVLPYIVAQVLGAMLGAILVWLTYRDHYEATDDADAIFGSFATEPALDNPVSNVLTEAIGTFVLVFGILMFGLTEMAAGVGTLAVAFLIISIGVSLGGPTGYAINPARDFGPRLVHHLLPLTHKGSSHWSYAWVPIVGPIIGAVVAALLYNVLA